MQFLKNKKDDIKDFLYATLLAIGVIIAIIVMLKLALALQLLTQIYGN